MPAIEDSFFADVSRLPGGHLLRHTAGRTSVHRWWQPEPTDVPRRYEDAVERLRELLVDSVALRLRSACRSAARSAAAWTPRPSCR